ncbi:hypothetical protein ACFWA6_12690 [Streptomyces sp. NPDC060020]|uniref:hypothetical protein n=1 Tax=Streptomyces sp. NPDC060020 TaxID=3347038 RepID=UPI0036A61AAB
MYEYRTGGGRIDIFDSAAELRRELSEYAVMDSATITRIINETDTHGVYTYVSGSGLMRRFRRLG